MFGLLLRSELLQGSAVRTWNCVLNIANYFRYKFTNFRQPVMPRSRRRHHSRSRSRSHSHERDRDVKRRRVESPENSHHRRSVSEESNPTPKKIPTSPVVPDLETSTNKILNTTTDSDISPKKVMSPAQLKKLEEKRRLKQEKEEQRMKERKEKEEQKRKEKEEKEEQKRKEREEKEEQKRKEREEKEEQKRKEREEKEDQKRKEREEKELVKKKEREEKEEQKRKEREQKELKRQQEIDEKNREKKKKEELTEKEKARFFKFFRKSTNANEFKKTDDEVIKTLAFMPFEIKSDMRLAPTTRSSLTNEQKENLFKKLEKQTDTVLYLDEIKQGKKLGKSLQTWPIEDENDLDIVLIEDADIGERVEEQPKAEKMRAKLLKFDENRRPAYFGTWRKKSKVIKPRKPHALDKNFFDYEVDSDDDWEEEEPGESLHGSDDEEKDNESDDYEVDNEFFVPHGYLSDEEVEAEENQELSPEIQKEKLKMLQLEFDEEMKSKTERIKPRLIGCIWENKLIPKVQDAIHKFLDDRMMIFSGVITIQKRDLLNTSVKINASKPMTQNRKQLTEELIPVFLNLIHGNTNNRKMLVNEFLNYLSKQEIDISVSKLGLTSQLKKLAKWKKCPDEGIMLNKFCWYVDEEIRNKYNLNLGLPNNWTYTLNVSEDNLNFKKKLNV